MKAAWAKLLPVAVGAIGVLLLVYWVHGRGQGVSLAERVPGTDRIGVTVPSVKPVDLRGTLVMGEGKPAEALAMGERGVLHPSPEYAVSGWPGFRGPRLDGVSAERVRLARQWGPEGPAKLWSLAVGEGYAGAAVLNGRVYLLDYDQKRQADVLRCLSLADGKELWSRWYSVDVKRNHGMSRTVPAVTEKYAVTMGPKCHVVCVDAASGEYRWGIDLVQQFGTKVPPWYAGQCPLIDGDRAIIAPGGESLMIAVDCATGEVVWKAPNPRRWEMTHSSIVPMTFRGRRMYVYCGSGGVAGVSAEDGAILWQTDQWKVSIATVPSPVVVEEGRTFLSGGYGAGSMMLGLKEEDGKLTAAPVYRLPPEVFGAEQQTPILYRGYIYGVIPGGQLVCLDPATGKQVWSSGSANRFGIGPYMIADGLIILMNDTGTLSLVEATPDGFARVAKADVLEHGHEAWGPLALAGGRLIARDLTRMVCLDVKESRHE